MSHTNDPAALKTSSRIPLDATRLRQARQNKHLTLEEVSAAVSINKMTLLRYETGDIRAIAPERLERLAALYDVTPAYLHGIGLDQEFTTDLGLQLIPFHADPPTPLGRRLATFLSLAKPPVDNQSPATNTHQIDPPNRHCDTPLAEPGAGS